MMAYESWLRAEKPMDRIQLENWPPTYLTFFQDWPEAFEFYRHHAFGYASRALQRATWGPLINSLARRAQAADPRGFEALREALAVAPERFLRQQREASRLVSAMAEPRAARQQLAAGLAAYAALYEIDLPLWFLGVIGKASKETSVDPKYLGGPETSAAQSSLVEQVAQMLTATPLEEPFRFAFDPPLRNSVAHNDFELLDEKGNIRVLDHKTGTSWTWDEAWGRIDATQHMHHAVLLAVQAIVANHLDPPHEFRDYGVLSMTTSLTADSSEIPTVVILQLWCFRDLDPDGRWIDQSALTVTTDGKRSVVQLTAHSAHSGPPIEESALKLLQRQSWMRVLRVPVAPAMGLGLPSLRTTKSELLEVVGPADEHFVPLILVSPENSLS